MTGFNICLLQKVDCRRDFEIFMSLVSSFLAGRFLDGILNNITLILSIIFSTRVS